jgi:excisionase family DNA binding protein
LRSVGPKVWAIRWVDEVLVGFMTTELDARPGAGQGVDDAGRSLLDELMTSRQVAALLQMRLSTVETYARRGLLPSVKVGRHRRFIRSQVEEALTALFGAMDPSK